MAFSYSSVSTYSQCPYLYKLKYIDKLKAKEDMDPANPLHIGTSIHEAIESNSIDHGIDTYKGYYEELTDDHLLEIYKMQEVLPKALKDIPRGLYEVKIETPDNFFVGYIDCLIPVSDGVYDLLDFKCSNNVSRYKNSSQIHVYKYFYELYTGNKIRNMYYVFIPKSTIKIGNGDIESAKKSVNEDLGTKEILFEQIKYNPAKVNTFLNNCHEIRRDTFFGKCHSTFCKWCEFNKYCSSKGEDTSEIDYE